MVSDEHCCCVKRLPLSDRKPAAQNAARIYPPNAPLLLSPLRAAAWDAGAAQLDGPSDLSVLTQNYWGPAALTLTVSFLEHPHADLRTRILRHMNAWKCSVVFKQATAGRAGDVRISLQGDGFWSYLGTDILQVPRDQPTMNLQGFSMQTPESEYRRVVRHETGHTLGFPHEQLRDAIVKRIDPEKAYKYFGETQGWDKATVDGNVLTPVAEGALISSPADTTSLMCYQLPASIMKDGQAVPGGTDITAADYEFCHSIYATHCSGKPHRKTVVDKHGKWSTEQDLSAENGSSEQ